MIKFKYHAVLEHIKLVLCDVDGVLTKGELVYSRNSESLKTFHVRDGIAVSLLKYCDVQVGIVSGRDSESLQTRASELNISLLKTNAKHKDISCIELIEKAGVSPSDTIFIGDDLVDIPAFCVCGVSCTVADAPNYIKKQANFVLNTKGGCGALRELADLIIVAKSKENIFFSKKIINSIL